MLNRKSCSMVLVMSAALLAACGGGSGSGGAAGAGAASPKVADAVPGLSKLGHFSSADGMVHLVIDRTGDKMKIRIDGAKDVIELTHEEVRRRMGGDLMGHAFIAPDGKRMLFVGVGGDLTFIKDERDELPLVRDGEGVALGTPTIKGPPPGPKPKEKSPHDLAAEEMEQLAVVKRFPQFKPEDAGDIAKVAQAYQLATADMLVHCGDNCAAWYAPHPVKDGKGGLGFVDEKKLSQGPATEEEKKAPLAKFNAWLRPDYEFGDWSHQVVKSSWLSIFQLEFKRLQPKAPALVWNVEHHDIFVVTPEGARYWESSADNNGKPSFVKGVAPQAEWPAPLRNNLLFKEHVAEMNKRGLVDKKLADEFQTINEKWGECAKKVFAGAQKEIEANMTGPNHYYSASNRNNLVRRKYNDKAMAECGGKRAEAIMAEILTKREADQKALYEKNKAKIASLVK
jgi:hypothetical protein